MTDLSDRRFPPVCPVGSPSISSDFSRSLAEEPFETVFEGEVRELTRGAAM